jgi:hypothetical protein
MFGEGEESIMVMLLLEGEFRGGMSELVHYN